MKMSLSLLAVFTAAVSFAAVTVDPVFTSNMVLQQEKPIAFFGVADAGTPITVDFAGKKNSIKTGADGKWRTEFPAMKAGKTAYTVTVSDGKKTIVLNNVVVGDVWVCSGQSNMEMPIAFKVRRGWSAANCEQEVAAANYPMIRHMKQRLIPSHNKEIPASIIGNAWTVCSPKVAGNYSATAFFFGRKLYRDLDIPIGLVNLSWGGTKIEPWISRDQYEKIKTFELEQIRKFSLSPEQKIAFEKKELDRYQGEIGMFQQKMDVEGAQAKAAAAGYSKSDLDDSAWEKFVNKKDNCALIRWYRTSFTLPADTKYQNVKLSFPSPVARAYSIYVNGQEVVKADASDFTPGKKTELQLPEELLVKGGKNVVAVRAYFFFREDTHLMNYLSYNICITVGKKSQRLVNWKQKDEFAYDWMKAKVKLPGLYVYPYKTNQFPSNLFNGMVSAWTKLPVKGVIWYQGCSNAGQAHYYVLLKALIDDWRTKWNDPKLPFIIVQLAGFGDGKWQTSAPTDASYALTRDIQMQMLEIPNVGVACAIDIGEPTNIHPANKQDLGIRLALEAERIAYGKSIKSQGPIYDHAIPEGTSIRVFYKNVDKGLKTSDGKAPGAFAVAGADKKFYWAQAKIDGNTVVCSAPQVEAPKYVRYAYAMYRGDCNLYNTEGLPAYPFRSDRFDYANVK